MKTRASRIVGWLGLVALCLSSAACKKDSPTSPTSNTPVVVPDSVVETFTGALTLGERKEHNFVVVAVGNAQLTITALAPLATLTVGLGIGNVGDDGSCIVFAQDDSVRVGETLLAGQLAVGTYCVRIYDVGNIFAGQEVTYSVEVTHT